MELSPKQSEAFELATSGEKDVLLYGGAIRGGKTVWLLTTFCYLASEYAGSRWVIVRESLPTLKRTTLVSFQALLSEGLSQYVSDFNRDTFTVTFKNNSQIIFMAESFDTDKELNRFRGLEINGAGAEEINELQEATFNKLIERTGTWLKAGDVPSVILATCNPTHNWVKSKFYDRWKNGTLPESWAYIQAKITDNPFIPKSYLEGLKANMMPLDYQRFVEGDWEVIEISNQFAYEWSDEHHIKPCIHRDDKQLIISMDFNIEPFGFIYSHVWQDSEGWHCHIFMEETIKDGSIIKAVNSIRSKFTQNLWNCIITGDYNGNKKEISQNDHASNFEQIRRELRLKHSQIQTIPNPKHVNSRNDLNYILYHSRGNEFDIDFRIDPKCENTIRDMRFVEADGTGSIIKSNRKDIHQLADHLDCVRYLVNHHSVKQYLKYRQKMYI
jgi:hypothetical protein